MAFVRTVTKPYFMCLSTDTKLTEGISVGSHALETDTSKEYIFDGTAWVLQDKLATDAEIALIKDEMVAIKNSLTDGTQKVETVGNIVDIERISLNLGSIGPGETKSFLLSSDDSVQVLNLVCRFVNGEADKGVLRFYHGDSTDGNFDQFLNFSSVDGSLILRGRDILLGNIVQPAHLAGDVTNLDYFEWLRTMFVFGPKLPVTVTMTNNSSTETIENTKDITLLVLKA